MWLIDQMPFNGVKGSFRVIRSHNLPKYLSTVDNSSGTKALGFFRAYYKTFKLKLTTMMNKLMITPLYNDYVNLIVELLKAKLGDNLVSVVLFGSVARGEAGEGSDIDLLVVLESFNDSFGERFRIFQEIENELLTSRSRLELRKRRLGTLISPIPLTKDEVKQHPPIMLDILTDGIILYDKDDFIKRQLNELQERLKALGARKVRLPDGRWYWDLKPDYKMGEVVEI